MYPIVLAHGIARFDFLLDSINRRLALAGDFLHGVLRRLREHGIDLREDSLQYFKGIATDLEDAGFTVYHSRVSFAAGVTTRAADLAREINRFLSEGHRKVHIIAHSMGGLDARHMIVDGQLGMADKVASLTTIGTPHNGTSFADWGIANGGHQLIQDLSGILDLGGFADLTTTACRQFNNDSLTRRAEATNAVIYKTYDCQEERAEVFRPLQGPWDIINAREGENDGLVPVSSQRWQDVITDDQGNRKEIAHGGFPVPADHLNEIGWWDLDELHGFRPLNIGILTAKRDFERQIRNCYLDIAEGLRTIV